MEYVSAHQMKQIDKYTIEDFGIPSIVLMENAGRGASQTALDMLSNATNKKVICVCGKGNNGGDGFMCARHLVNKGVEVEVFLMGESSQLKGDAKINFDTLKYLRPESLSYLNSDKEIKLLEGRIENCQHVIDAIFGIGLSGQVKEPYSKVIRMINDSGNSVLAIDVPSGLEATTGKALGGYIKAEKTVTFGLSKTGFIKEDGPQNMGEIVVVDISIPRKVVDKFL